MNKLSLALNVVLCIGLIVLYILFFSSKSGKSTTANVDSTNDENVTHEGTLPIAYIQLDSFVLQYDFAIEEQQKLINKQEDSQLVLNQRGKSLEAEYSKFQQKVQNNIFQTRERMAQEQNRIMKMEEDIQKLNAKYTEELYAEDLRIKTQLNDSINKLIEIYNTDKKYQVVLSNGGILYADETYNITKDFIKLANSRYKK